MKLKKSLAVVLTSAALFSMCTGTMVEASKRGGSRRPVQKQSQKKKTTPSKKTNGKSKDASVQQNRIISKTSSQGNEKFDEEMKRLTERNIILSKQILNYNRNTANLLDQDRKLKKKKACFEKEVLIYNQGYINPYNKREKVYSDNYALLLKNLLQICLENPDNLSQEFIALVHSALKESNTTLSDLENIFQCVDEEKTTTNNSITLRLALTCLKTTFLQLSAERKKLDEDRQKIDNMEKTLKETDTQIQKETDKLDSDLKENNEERMGIQKAEEEFKKDFDEITSSAIKTALEKGQTENSTTIQHIKEKMKECYKDTPTPIKSIKIQTNSGKFGVTIFFEDPSSEFKVGFNEAQIMPEDLMNTDGNPQIDPQKLQVFQMPTDNTSQNPMLPINPNGIGNVANSNNLNNNINDNSSTNGPANAATIGIDMQNIVNTGLPQMAPNINPTQNNPMTLPHSPK